MPAAHPAAGNRVSTMSLHHALAVAALIGWAGAERVQMTFTTLDSGASSQIEESRHVVVRTVEEWSKLWTQHGGEGKAPEVDFSRATVIAVFLGTRPTAGHSVEITRIDKDDAGLVVTWRERAPAAGDLVAQMLTSPFFIVRTESHGGPVRFTRTR